MSRNTLIETSLSEDAVRGREVLLPIQTLFFQRLKFGIRPNFQRSTVFGPAHCAIGLVVGALFLERARLEGCLAVSL